MPSFGGRSPLRLLVVGNGPTAVGDDGTSFVEQPCGELLLNLVDLGYAVAFVQPVESLRLVPDYYGCVLPKGKVESIGLDRRTPIQFGRTIGRLLWVLLRADIVYFFFPGALSRLLAKLCRILRKPYGIYLRGEQFRIDGSDGTTFRKAKFILSVSRSLAERTCHLNQNSIVIRPMCQLTATDAVRRNFSSRDLRPLRLLFVGRLEAKKGVPELLEAAELLQEWGFKIELTLVGGGVLSSVLSKRYPELSGSIRIAGVIEDRAYLMRLYEEADVFVMPSHHEGFPRVLYEAMIKSVVVITTMVGGVPGLMENDKNCLAIEVGNAHAIAWAVKKLAKDRALMQHLADNGLVTVLDALENNPSHFHALRTQLSTLGLPALA